MRWRNPYCRVEKKIHRASSSDMISWLKQSDSPILIVSNLQTWVGLKHAKSGRLPSGCIDVARAAYRRIDSDLNLTGAYPREVCSVIGLWNDFSELLDRPGPGDHLLSLFKALWRPEYDVPVTVVELALKLGLSSDYRLSPEN